MTATADLDQDAVPDRSHRADRWPPAGLAALLAVAAVTYLYGLGRAGYANSFYAAAVQAGTRSWKAWLFGSLDAGNVITVDKPPAALWVMGLSARLFGFSSWSMLVPQALMGVASVWLLYAAVRRWAGPAAGLVAGGLLALSPVAVLMFRFNNPDALLVLVMVAAAYAVVRAVDAGERQAGTGWLVCAGVLVGFGFLTKMLQVLLVVPALAGVYLLAAPGGWGRRVRGLMAGGVAAVLSAGWYVALVTLWPASARPYIGGSTDNSLLELALGYNGLSRILGREHAEAGGLTGHSAGLAGHAAGVAGDAGMAGAALGHGGHGLGGTPGLTRLFTPTFADYVSWLLPAGLLVLVAALWLTRHAPRSDRTRAGLLLWGGWLLVAGVVLSSMRGTMHPYYVLAMAPALAGTLAVGAGEVWRHRERWPARATLGVGVLGSAVWSWVLLSRDPSFEPWLRWVVLVVGVAAAIALVVPRPDTMPGWRWSPRAGGLTLLAGVLVVALGGPAAVAARTALDPTPRATLPIGSTAAGPRPRGFDHPVSTQLAQLLRTAGTPWSAATLGSQQAASLELPTGTSVVAIGGFTGSDPVPTLAEFQRMVTTRQVRYFVVPTGNRRGPGAHLGPAGNRPGVGAAISAWVTAHYRATTVDGYLVYDLASPSTQRL